MPGELRVRQVNTLVAKFPHEEIVLALNWPAVIGFYGGGVAQCPAFRIRVEAKGSLVPFGSQPNLPGY